jgi:hypothetical protein
VQRTRFSTSERPMICTHALNFNRHQRQVCCCETGVWTYKDGERLGTNVAPKSYVIDWQQVVLNNQIRIRSLLSLPQVVAGELVIISWPGNSSSIVGQRSRNLKLG